MLRDLGLDQKRFTPRGVHGVISNWKNELVLPAERRGPGGEHLRAQAAPTSTPSTRPGCARPGRWTSTTCSSTPSCCSANTPTCSHTYQQRFEHILVDEFQDTNTAQNEMVLQLGARTRTSPSWATPTSRSIDFRGADFRNILQFEEAFEDVTTVVLDQNYRSTQNILDAANAVIANNAGRKPKHLWTDQGAGEQIVRFHGEDEGDEATWVGRRLRDLHEGGRDWREMAIFYRTNAQSRVMEEALMRFGVPYKVVGGTRFYDRREIKDAMAYLKAIVNPADEVSVKRVLNVPKRGVGDASIARLDAFAASRGHHVRRGRAAVAARRGSSGPAGRGLDRVHRPARPARRRWRPTVDAPGDVLQAALDDSGYLAEMEAENSVEAARPGREPVRAGRFGTGVHADRRVPRAGRARRRHRRARRRRPGRADDAALGQGPRVPGRVPDRAGGGRVPPHPCARPSPTSWRRSAGSPTWGSPGPARCCTSATPGAATCSGARSTTRRRASSTRSPPRSCARRATCPGAAATGASPSAGVPTGARSSGPPPAYKRRAALSSFDPDEDEHDAHRERVVDAALAAGRRNAPQPSNSQDIGLQVGDDVEHPSFGEGVIVEIRGSGDKAEATVRFRERGTKHLALAWAPLKKL